MTIKYSYDRHGNAIEVNINSLDKNTADLLVQRRGIYNTKTEAEFAGKPFWIQTGFDTKNNVAIGYWE